MRRPELQPMRTDHRLRLVVGVAAAAVALAAAGEARAQTPATNWTAQVSQSDCNTTTTFSSSLPRAEVGACQSYNADIYEKWDPSGSNAGQVDLLACDYFADANFYYMRWDARTNWSDEGHRYYQELELNRALAGGDAWPDIYVEYAPKSTHVGATWQALGGSQIFLSRDLNNNYGCATSRLTPSAQSCADGYEADVVIPAADAYGRIRGGNLEVAIRRTRLDLVDDSAATVAPVATRCWASQSSTIDKTKVAWHDEQPTSDLTGMRFDNNRGADTSTWPVMDPNPVLLTLVKTSTAFSDPINATANPKLIPGGVALYTVIVSNSSAGSPSANSVTVTDGIPAGMTMFVGDIGAPGSGPVFFIDSVPASGVSYNFTSLDSTTDSIAFSRNGGASFNYTPVPDANGFDAAVTDIRVRPSGTLGGTPRNFRLQFRMGVK